MDLRIVPIIASIFFLITSHARAIDLPVFYLKYDGGVGSQKIEQEQGEDEEQIEPSSYRNTINLRVKEQFSPIVTANLYTAFSRKEYLFDKGSYFYVYLNPDLAWQLTEAIKFYGGFRSKWTFYDELDSKGLSKNVNALLAKANLTFKLIDGLKLTPSFQTVFDLYENTAKLKQTYTFGINIDTKLDHIALGAKYTGILQYPLGDQSTVAYLFNNQFRINLTWDPN